jgi:hypothetical protein
MSSLRVIPYAPSDLSALLDGFEAERGFLGIFPSLVAQGRIYGVVDAPLTVSVNPEHGYMGAAGSRDALLSKIIESVVTHRPDVELLVQDIWALEEDYRSKLLSSKDVILIDGSVYIPVDSSSASSSIRDTLAKTVSSMAVLIFADAIGATVSTSVLAEHTFGVAIEAFDGQGWLVWARQQAVGVLSGIQGVATA